MENEEGRGEGSRFDASVGGGTEGGRSHACEDEGEAEWVLLSAWSVRGLCGRVEVPWPGVRAAEVARLCGVSEETVRAWARGRREYGRGLVVEEGGRRERGGGGPASTQALLGAGGAQPDAGTGRGLRVRGAAWPETAGAGVRGRVDGRTAAGRDWDHIGEPPPLGGWSTVQREVGRLLVKERTVNRADRKRDVVRYWSPRPIDPNGEVWLPGEVGLWGDGFASTQASLGAGERVPGDAYAWLDALRAVDPAWTGWLERRVQRVHRHGRVWRWRCPGMDREEVRNEERSTKKVGRRSERFRGCLGWVRKVYWGEGDGSVKPQACVGAEGGEMRAGFWCRACAGVDYASRRAVGRRG